MKKYFEKFNWITDCVRRLDFWSGGVLSKIIIGASSKMTNLIPNIVSTLLISFGLMCGIIGVFNGFRQRKKNNILKSAEKTTEYISIQEASDILTPQLTKGVAFFLESHAESAFWYLGKDTDFQDSINKTIRISLYTNLL